LLASFLNNYNLLHAHTMIHGYHDYPFIFHHITGMLPFLYADTLHLLRGARLTGFRLRTPPAIIVPVVQFSPFVQFLSQIHTATVSITKNMVTSDTIYTVP
jgi:hypothetical protein